MLFWENDEAQTQKRISAQKQYAEELRKQIEEKQKQTKTPDYQIKRNQTPPILQPTQRSNPPQTTQIKNQSYQTRTPIENQRVASPRLDPLPNLQPISADTSPSVIRFSDRLNWLEKSLDQHHSILQSSVDISTKIERSTIPSFNDAIGQLRSAVDRIISNDIPLKLNPITNELQKLEDKIATHNSNCTASMQDLKDSFTSATNTFTQTQSKFSEFTDSIKNLIIELKTETTQVRDTREHITNDISNVDSMISTIDESIRSLNASLQSLENSSANESSNAEQQINSSVQSQSLQFAQSLKTETETLNQSFSTVHSQIAEANQRCTSLISTLQSSFSEITNNFNQSIETLSSSFQTSIETIHSDSSKQFNEISERVNSILNETETNFNTIQNESATTLTTLNESIKKIRTEIEDGLKSEIEIRKNNEYEIVQHYDNFKSLIINEMKLQINQLENVCINETKNFSANCSNNIYNLMKEINELKEKTKIIENLNPKVNATENMINQINNILISKVGEMSLNSSKIQSEMEKMEIENLNEFNEYKTKSENLLKHKIELNLVPKKTVEEELERLQSKCENKLKYVERQITIVFACLAKLNEIANGDAQSGALIIEEMSKMKL
ncbi:hypothetical protein GPJ56_004061 [Histomonas meleagridis]|uniref:uncharacterized protein n=1 Tax=Histomonas meleagridis TaxID=135588 RepID=UPI0035598463|nr:hypothetical protein GPJ56_004061 [Histomonas meleagridis]KAH0799458.1 hypothetical protein GO595_007713 [Histomonas meleagridis]